MKKKWTLIVTCFFLQALAVRAQQADLILTNGKIFTADYSGLFVTAIAIRGDKVLATGSDAAIGRLAGPGTKRVDLEHKTVVPGFNDAHDHPGYYARIGKGFDYPEVDAGGLSKEAVLDSVRLLLVQAKPGEWIHGFIGTKVLFDTSMRGSLDSIAPRNPVLLQAWWGHGCVANRLALQAAGISDSSGDPVGGWYTRAPGGHTISALWENAQAAVWIAYNRSGQENLIQGLRTFSGEQLKAGITSVQYMGTGFDLGYARIIFRKADLAQRIRVIAWPRSTDRGRQLADWQGNGHVFGSRLAISGVKYCIDGTPIELNSLRTYAYDKESRNFGRLNYPRDTMRRIFREALGGGQQLMMHITGDSSFSVTLSLMLETAKAEAWQKKRVRLEHNCVADSSGHLSAATRHLMKSINLLVMQTPKYCMGSPLRSLLDSGIRVGISPDGTTNPFVDIMMLTTNASDPKENLTREQAVIAYTATNAYAEFAESEKGTLVKGKFADLAVLSQDIFTIPADQLPATVSVITMVGGKIVYGKL